MSDHGLRALERRVNATRSREALAELDAALARVDGGPWLPAVRRDLHKIDQYEGLWVELLFDQIRRARLPRAFAAIAGRAAAQFERRVRGQIFGVATGPTDPDGWVMVDMNWPWVDPAAEARAAESFARANPRGVPAFQPISSLLEQFDRATQLPPASPRPSGAPGPG